MRQRDIFTFWLPLFASWLLMTAEGPIITAAINRLPNEVVMLAAHGIVFSLAVTIESPVINLLATTTALVSDRQSYEVVRRFTIHLAVALTVIAAVVAFTPLFDFIVVRLLATPLPIAQWVRPGLQVMTFWSAAIAWRRFLQGVLIHFGYTKMVGWGTAVRLIASAGTATSLALLTELPGIIIGTSALMAGVIAEAIFATIAVRPLFTYELRPGGPASADALTYRELFWFHLPLAATAFLTLLAQPMVALSLARLDNPTLSLAAWPLIFQILLVARAAAMAWPEAVIALTRDLSTYLPVRRFTYLLAGTTLVGMIVLVSTPLLEFYLVTVQDADLTVASLAAVGTAYFIVYPSLSVLISWLRGLLIQRRTTTVVNVGMLVNLTITAAILITGIVLKWNGILAAAIALNLAILAEILLLVWRAGAVLGLRLQSFFPLSPLSSGTSKEAPSHTIV